MRCCTIATMDYGTDPISSFRTTKEKLTFLTLYGGGGGGILITKDGDVPPLAKSATWYMKTAYKMQNLVIKWVDLKNNPKFESKLAYVG